MTLERAIEVLLRERHRGHALWRRFCNGKGCPVEVRGSVYWEWLTEFEATAIAEKYEREREATK